MADQDKIIIRKYHEGDEQQIVGLLEHARANKIVTDII